MIADVDNPNFVPLAQLLGEPEMVNEFMWMYRDENGVEFYKHYSTRRYIGVDESLNCYGGSDVALVDKKAALAFVFDEEAKDA